MTTSSGSVGHRSRPRGGLMSLIRAAYAAPLLCVLMAGVAMHLGGAPALAVPLWALVALLALWLAGIDPPTLRNDPLLVAAAVLIGVMGFQIVPLPPFLLDLLDRQSAELTAGALDAFHVDRAHAWRPLHLDPGNGWANLQYVVGLLAAYLAARQVARRGRGDTLATGAALSTLWIVLLALMHKTLGVEQVYGFYTPVQGTPHLVAPLINLNHLAAFAGAGAILWAGRAGVATNSLSTAASWIASLACGVVCVLTLSRAGVAAALGGMVLFALLTTWTRAPSERSRRVSLRVAGGAAAAAMGAAYVGWTALRAEFGTHDVTKLTSIGLELRLLSLHPLLGAGMGGLRSLVVSSGRWGDVVYPDYAESLPVDLAVAIGPVAAAVVIALGATWLWRVRIRKRNTPRPTEIALFCAFLSIVVHDTLDFSLWLGATGYLAAILAALLTSQAEVGMAPNPQRSARGRHRVWIALAALGCAAVAMITVHSPSYLDERRAVADPPPSDGERRAAMLRHPGDAFLAYASAVSAVRVRDPNALRFVNRAMLLAPNWPGPHLILIRALLLRGLRSQALIELRYAAAAANPPTNVLAHILASLAPTDEEILHAMPSGEAGRGLLAMLGTSTADPALAARVDALLAAREPDDPHLIAREAGRARERHDTAGERAAFGRLCRVAPRDPTGYVGLAQSYLATGDTASAERVLRTGVTAGAEARVLLTTLADVQTQRHDTGAVRATMQRVMDLSGADVGRRINALADLARFERRLGNNGAALSAYERADEMSLPEHPFLGDILSTASQLHDLARVRGVCFTLAGQGDMDESQRQQCSAAENAASAVAP